jgi:acetyltransferase-like isoleucine patch superfamily enzyme
VLESEVFVGPAATFTNDVFPRAWTTDWTIVPTTVRTGASIGANATVVCGVVIGAYAMVGAGAVVTSDVPANALVIGVPARIVGWVCRCGARLGGAPPRDPVERCSACDTTVMQP